MPIEKGRLYVLDSLYQGQLSASLEIQLAKIYGCNKSLLSVFVPNVQQQNPGSVDCGIFAVAMLWSFVLIHIMFCLVMKGTGISI